MKPDYKIPYEKLRFVWISNHYDIHLSGLCRVEGELMRFAAPPRYSGRGLPRMHVFKMSPLEKLLAVLDKFLFELCVGKHWTYPRGAAFYIKRPKWFWRLVFHGYYQSQKVCRLAYFYQRRT